MININGIGVVVFVKLFALSPCLPSLWLGIPIVIFLYFFLFISEKFREIYRDKLGAQTGSFFERSIGRDW